MALQHIHLQAPTPISFVSKTTIFFLLIIGRAATLSFDYQGFRNGDVKLEGDASISSSIIQVTMNKSHSIGRVTSSKQMHLWDMSSRNLTDFTTEFSFAIFSQESNYGDGMAFFLADPNLPFSNNLKQGAGLGLVVGNTQFNSGNHYPFIAVEFDTYHDPNWDRIGKYVGIPTLVSNETETWYCNISNTKVYNARIVYNSSTRNFSISFTGYLNGTATQQHLSFQVDLRDYLPEWVTFGFSAATGDSSETHTLKSWSFKSSLEIEEEDATISTPQVPNISPKNVRKRGLRTLKSWFFDPILDIREYATSSISQAPAPAPAPAPTSTPTGSAKNPTETGLWVGLGIGLSALFCFVGLAWFVLFKD